MKTKIFYFVAVLAVTMISFTSCSKEDDEIVPETPKEEPTENLIINLTQLNGEWDFQSVKIGNNTYTNSGDILDAGYTKFDYVMDLTFVTNEGVYEGKPYHEMKYYPETSNEGNNFFYEITSDNKIVYNNSYTIQIQSYSTTTKVLIFKIVSVKDTYNWNKLLNCIYTYKKK